MFSQIGSIFNFSFLNRFFLNGDCHCLGMSHFQRWVIQYDFSISAWGSSPQGHVRSCTRSYRFHIYIHIRLHPDSSWNKSSFLIGQKSWAVSHQRKRGFLFILVCSIINPNHVNLFIRSDAWRKSISGLFIHFRLNQGQKVKILQFHKIRKKK